MGDSAPADYETPAKRACFEHGETPGNHSQILKCNGNDTSTILDWLNRDCFAAVLKCLPFEDILRSLTVSRQWREWVLEYLRGAHFCFEYYYTVRTHFIPRLLGLNCNNSANQRTFPYETCHGNFSNFETKICELGPGIESIKLDRLTEKILETITLNCPNLKELMIVGMQGSYIEWEPAAANGQQKVLLQCDMLSFTEEVQQCLQSLQLERLSFVHSPKITEDYIGEFLKTESLEELIICRNQSVDGHCLSRLHSTSLKSLRLIACSLIPYHLTSVVYRLTNLTMLELCNNPVEILQSVHMLLDKTPKLEHLSLNSYAKTDVGHEFLESVCRLGCLKHLNLCWNDNVCDAWLEALAVGCPRLQTVDIEARTKQRPSSVHNDSPVTKRGLRALWRGLGPGLTHLGLACHAGVTGDLLAECISCCPKLQSLDLRWCTRASLVACADAARGRAPPLLRLRVARTAIGPYTRAPEGLFLDFVDAPRLIRLV